LGFEGEEFFDMSGVGEFEVGDDVADGLVEEFGDELCVVAECFWCELGVWEAPLLEEGGWGGYLGGGGGDGVWGGDGFRG